MAEQLTLITGGDGILVAVDPAGVSTGERIRAQRPEVYDLVVRSLAEGMSCRAIARATGLSPVTIAAIRDLPEHADAIGTAKEAVKRSLRQSILLCSERLVEEHDQIPLGQLSVSLGIQIDKLAMLEGAPTSVVEHRTVPDHESIQVWLDSLRPAQPVGRAEGGGKREGLEGPAGADGDGLAEQGEGARADRVSDDPVTMVEAAPADGDRDGDRGTVDPGAGQVPPAVDLEAGEKARTRRQKGGGGGGAQRGGGGRRHG